MSDLLQPGHHPDADQLNAFAEHALPEHERLETLAHLAKCPDCRQIVFLAQEALESVSPLPHSLPVRTSWLRNWHNLWPFAAALTCGLLVSAFVHHRQPEALPKKSEVASVSSASQPSVYTPPSTPALSVPQPSLKTPAPAKVAPTQHHAPATARAGVAETGSVNRNPLTGPITSPSTFRRNEFPASRQPLANAAAASPHALGGAIGGPVVMAPPPQQLKDSLLAAGQTQTVEIQSQNQPLSQRASAPLPRSEPSQSDSQQIVNQTVTVTSAAPLVQTQSAVLSTSVFSGKAALAKTAKAPLPSRKPAASTISNGLETLAVDTEGDLFLSKDPSVAWQRITHQWTGKAVKVSLADPSSTMQAGGNASAGASSSVEATKPASPTKKAVFELTTDTGTTWSSPDGLIWKHQ